MHVRRTRRARRTIAFAHPRAVRRNLKKSRHFKNSLWRETPPMMHTGYLYFCSGRGWQCSIPCTKAFQDLRMPFAGAVRNFGRFRLLALTRTLGAGIIRAHHQLARLHSSFLWSRRIYDTNNTRFFFRSNEKTPQGPRQRENNNNKKLGKNKSDVYAGI